MWRNNTPRYLGDLRRHPRYWQICIKIRNCNIRGIPRPREGVADPDPVLFGAFLIHGSGMGKKSGSGIQDEHPGSYFPELRNNFLDYKYV
jgi:hypothetical protein